MLKLTVDSTSPIQFNGIAIDSKGRKFISMPNWKDKPKYSIGMITKTGISPYPSLSVNLKFKDVNAVHIVKDIMYVVDIDQLHSVNLSTNSFLRTYKIPNSSRLNDIRVLNNFAYITDSGNGSIVKLDLTSGSSSTHLLKSKLTKAEFGEVNADGIEISADKKYLIWTKPFGGHIYQIPIDYLDDESKIEDMGRIPKHGGILISDDGHFLYSDIENKQIVHRILDTGKEKILAESEDMKWPDALIEYNKSIYIPCAQYDEEEPKAPFKLMKFNLP